MRLDLFRGRARAVPFWWHKRWWLTLGKKQARSTTEPDFIVALRSATFFFFFCPVLVSHQTPRSLEEHIYPPPPLQRAEDVLQSLPTSYFLSTASCVDLWVERMEIWFPSQIREWISLGTRALAFFLFSPPRQSSLEDIFLSRCPG
jgi:hypothetical protein